MATLGGYYDRARLLPMRLGAVRRLAAALRAAWNAEDHAPAVLEVEATGEAAVLSPKTFAARFDEVRPLYVRFAGRPLDNPALAELVAYATRGGAVAELVTDGLALTPEWASDLLDAGLGWVRVEDNAKSRRNLEKLIGMRDARRLPGPETEVVPPGPPATGPCRLPWYSVGIRADGSVAPCIRHAGQAGTVAEVQRSPAMRTFRQNLRAARNHPACRACPHDDAALLRVLRR